MRSDVRVWQWVWKLGPWLHDPRPERPHVLLERTLMVEIFNLEVWQSYWICVLFFHIALLWVLGHKQINHWFPRFLFEYHGLFYVALILFTSTGCGTAPSRLTVPAEESLATSTDIAIANAQSEFDQAFEAAYHKKPKTDVPIVKPVEVRTIERKARGRTLPKAKPVAVKVKKPVVVKVVEVEPPAPPPPPVAQRRVAPPESTVPCYLHAPPPIQSGDVVEFRNETQNHVGFRVNGEFVTVVGAIPQPNTRALPYGVTLTPSLLPPGMRCYFAMRTPGGSHHIDSVLFRVDPYSGRPQTMGAASDYVTIGYPRSRAYVYAFKTYLY